MKLIDLGNVSIDEFCDKLFDNDYKKPCSVFFTIEQYTLQSTLVYILLKGVKKLFNLTDINSLTTEDFELLHCYFKSFGYNIIYEKVLKNDVPELSHYNVGFIPYKD